MKFIKGIGYVVAVFLFCFGIGVCCAHQSVKHVFSAPAIDAAIDKLVDSTVSYGAKSLYSYLPESIQNNLPPTDEIIKSLPKDVQTKIEETKHAIAQDPQVHDMLSKYSEAVLSKLDDAGTQLPDIQSDMEAIIQVKLPLVASALGIEFSQGEVNRFAKEISTDIDLQPVIEQGIEEVRGKISPQETKMLSLASFVQSKKSLWLASFCFGMSALFIVWMKKSMIKMLPFMGVLSLLGGGLIFAGATSAKMMLQSDVVGIADGIFTALNDTSAMFIIGGVCLLFLYFILHIGSKIFRRKQNEVAA